MHIHQVKSAFFSFHGRWEQKIYQGALEPHNFGHSALPELVTSLIGSWKTSNMQHGQMNHGSSHFGLTVMMSWTSIIKSLSKLVVVL